MGLPAHARQAPATLTSHPRHPSPEDECTAVCAEASLLDCELPEGRPGSHSPQTPPSNSQPEGYHSRNSKEVVLNRIPSI